MSQEGVGRVHDDDCQQLQTPTPMTTTNDIALLVENTNDNGGDNRTEDMKITSAIKGTSPSTQDGDFDAGKRYWDRKLKCYSAICCMGYTKNKPSFDNVCDLFAKIDTHPYGGSSVIRPAFNLLKRFREAQQHYIVHQQPELGIKQFLSNVPITADTKFLDMSNHDDVYLVGDIIYYMNHSLTIFGYGIYAIDGIHQLCCLIPYLKCSDCFCRPFGRRGKRLATIQDKRGQSSELQINDENTGEDIGEFPIAAINDNCCGCNVAAANRRLTGFNYDIIYVNYQSSVGKVPFLVIADHSKQTIVVVTRGSANLCDFINDANDAIEPIPLNPPDPDMYGHCGMVLAAKCIKETLDRDKILEAAFECRPDLGSRNYKLVFCGHSLGAGLASLLGLLYYSQYPTLRAYLYSPTGGIMSSKAMELSKKFAFGVMLGNDCVPRMGRAQLQRLKYQAIWAKQRLEASKPQTFFTRLSRAIRRSFCCRYNYFGCCLPDLDKGVSEDLFQYNPLHSIDLCFGHDRNCAPIEYQGRTITFPPKNQCLHVPGKLLHVVKDYSIKTRPKQQPARNPMDNEPLYRGVWVDNENYDQIVIDDAMFADHMPFAIQRGMKKLHYRTIPPIQTSQPRKSAN